MSRMFLVMSLLLGLALVGADWYVERGSRQDRFPSYEGGTPMRAVTPTGTQEEVKTMEGGTPIPPPQ